MKTISIIIPAYNEEKNIAPVYSALKAVFESCKNSYAFEIIFINDGSRDKTFFEMEKIARFDKAVQCLDFSRNFGKEIATTAGINHCSGEACIMLDADLQHPVELIPKLIEKWEQGAEVVIGVRRKNKSDSWIKKFGSVIFYKIINRITEVYVVPNATDFRLIDRVVIDEFNRFTETSRMTRALIDWLGFRRAYVDFDANQRAHGTASYSFWKLFNLAMSSFVSLSLVPLKLAGYLGLFITGISGLLGFYNLLGKYILHDNLPIFFAFSRTFSDAENLAILILFLVGIILMSIGLLALYVANIQREVIRRPLYVVRKKRSAA